MILPPILLRLLNYVQTAVAPTDQAAILVKLLLKMLSFCCPCRRGCRPGPSYLPAAAIVRLGWAGVNGALETEGYD